MIIVSPNGKQYRLRKFRLKFRTHSQARYLWASALSRVSILFKPFWIETTIES